MPIGHLPDDLVDHLTTEFGDHGQRAVEFLRSFCAQRPLYLRKMNQHPLDARSASLTASGRL
jgi:hypothetical protein